MKKIIACLVLFTAFIIACNSGKNKSLLSKPDDIVADEYVINIDKDTTLQTKNGALLKIPKGSLATDNGNTVVLEIKEAYSMEQMILAGLTTQSNGQPLSSGGMIYINAKAGQNVTIKQAIKVSTPANYLNPDMQLFKGEKDDKGNVNWNNPTPLPENKQLAGIEEGKRLFFSQCASCHSVDVEGTGPALAHFLKRFSGDKLLARGHTLHMPYPFWNESLLSDAIQIDTIGHNESKLSPELLYNQELYFCNLLKMYGSVGTSHPNLTEENINNIYKYIQNESDKRNLPLPSITYLDNCIDSCMEYNKVVGNLLKEKQRITKRKDTLIKDNGKMVKEKGEITRGTGDIPGPDNKVTPKNYNSVYYEFTIETFGWFNIDMLIKGKDGVKESELFVRIVGEYREKVQVYLIVPSVKVYVQGGPAERNAEEFAFQLKNGKIDLPQDAKAYILAVSETSSSIAYVLKEFTTTTRQEFEISLKETNKAEFNAAIKLIGGDGLKIDVKDTKNADEIRKVTTDLKVIEQELKKADNLKPKNCDCNCLPKTDAAISDSPKVVAELKQKTNLRYFEAHLYKRYLSEIPIPFGGT